jgi:hypothetical protein
MSNNNLLVYLPYSIVAVTLTVWLARALSRHGGVFLRDVFPDRIALADAVNQLLVIGFYLVNLGWALLLVSGDVHVTSPAEATSVLVSRLGILLLLLGVAHLFNLFVFYLVRSHVPNKAKTAP